MISDEDRRRLEELWLTVLRVVEDGPHPGARLEVDIRFDRAGHVCESSCVRPELRVLKSS